MNLDGMPSEKVEDVVTDPLVSARMGGVEATRDGSGDGRGVVGKIKDAVTGD